MDGVIGNNPFFDTDSTSVLGLSERQRLSTTTHGWHVPPRILLCFIDVKGTSQVAHYSLVPLPPTYEEAINVAFEAFESQLASSKLLRQPNVEFVLMIKCPIRLGDPPLRSVPTSTTIWADIHPRNQWPSLVRDGDEILMSAKMPQAAATVSPQDPRIQNVPENYAGPKIVFCHRPYGASEYTFITLALHKIQTYEDARYAAHALYQGQRKPFQGNTGWTTNHVKLYFNTPPRQKSGGVIGGITQTLIDSANWIGIRNEGMLDKSKSTEVEVVYEFR